MAEITDDVRFNRRWNYYVIRELWKINGRQSPDLYDEFEISKRRYTYLITGDDYITPQMLGVSKTLHDKIGADEKVFTGEILLNVDEFSVEDIKEYHDNLLNNKTWEIHEFRRKVRQKLKDMDYRTCSDNNLCRIEHFIRTAQKYSNTTNIEYIINTFKRVTISELESAYAESRLQEYIDNLQRQYDLAHSVMVYHNNK